MTAIKGIYEAETGELGLRVLDQRNGHPFCKSLHFLCIWERGERWLLATDAVRDKDGNAASIIFCELAASLKKGVVRYSNTWMSCICDMVTF